MCIHKTFSPPFFFNFSITSKIKVDITFQSPPSPFFFEEYCVVFCAHATNKGMYIKGEKQKLNEALPLDKKVRAKIV